MNYSISYREKDGTLTISNSLTKAAIALSPVSHDDATIVTEITAHIANGSEPKLVKKKIDGLLQSEHAATFIMFLFCWVHDYLAHVEEDYERAKAKASDRNLYPDAWRKYTEGYKKQKDNIIRIIKLCF